jgi:hypothetical protein
MEATSTVGGHHYVQVLRLARETVKDHSLGDVLDLLDAG